MTEHIQMDQSGLPLELGGERHAIEILNSEGEVVGILNLNTDWEDAELAKNMARNFIHRVNLHDRLVKQMGHLLWLVENQHGIDGGHITRDAHVILAEAEEGQRT